MSVSPRVVLVGTQGFGARHLKTLTELDSQQRIQLVGLVDRRFDDRDVNAPGSGGPFKSRDLRAGLEVWDVDTVVVATPPHTHLELALIALDHGAGLYLEKPPVPRVSDLRALSQASGGLRVDVGFQQARATMHAIERALRDHDIGEVHRVSAFGVLRRSDAYFQRAEWAGRWFLNGEAIYDGPLFNPCAHVLHTAFLVANDRTPGWAPAAVSAQCYSVRGFTGDDLTALRVEAAGPGPVVVAAATTAGDQVREPTVVVHGTRGTISVRHRDAATTVLLDGVERTYPPPSPEPSDALVNAVVNPFGPADPFLSLAAVEPFVSVVDATVTAARAPVSLVPHAATDREDGQEFRVLPGVTRAIERVVATGELFDPLRYPWATQPVHVDIATNREGKEGARE